MHMSKKFGIFVLLAVAIFALFVLPDLARACPS